MLPFLLLFCVWLMLAWGHVERLSTFVTSTLVPTLEGNWNCAGERTCRLPCSEYPGLHSCPGKECCGRRTKPASLLVAAKVFTATYHSLLSLTANAAVDSLCSGILWSVNED